MDTLRDTAIRVALIYKNGAKPVEGEHGRQPASRTQEIRGMSRYSWGRPRVTWGASHDGARPALAAPSSKTAGLLQ